MLQVVQHTVVTTLTRTNCVAAANDLEVAGEVIHGWVIRTPCVYTLF